MRALKKQDSWMWWWQIWEDLSSPLLSQRIFLSFPARSDSLITLHDGQDLVSLGLSQRPVGRPVPIVEPADSLWVQGSQQSDVEEDEGRAAQQQARPAFVSNVLPSALRHNAIVEFPTPQSPPVAQLTSGEPTSEYSQQNRDDEFDLDLEDIMVMEAIWLSIQVFCQLKVNGNMGLFSIPCNPSGRLVFNEDILCSLTSGLYLHQ
jgi:hypothetical protein